MLLHLDAGEQINLVRLCSKRYFSRGNRTGDGRFQGTAHLLGFLYRRGTARSWALLPCRGSQMMDLLIIAVVLTVVVLVVLASTY